MTYPVLIGLALLAIALAGCGQAAPAAAPTAAASYCPEGSHCIHPRLVAFYRAHEALLGPALANPGRYRGRLVQYVRAGRIEYVPENPPGWEVGLAYLAEEWCGRQPPLRYADVPSRYEAGRRYFAETGHEIEGDFLHFVEISGGVGFFGPPIAEQRAVGPEQAQDFLRVQVRQRGDGSFYLMSLGEITLTGVAPEGLCPSVPADNPDAQPGQADGSQDDR